MVAFHVFHLGTFDRLDDLIVFNLTGAHDFGCERFCHDVVFPACFDQRIVLVRMNGDRHVSGQRPCRGRPDDDVYFTVSGRVEKQSVVFREFEFDENRRAFVRCVFDLGFGKSRFILRAPVNRLHALVDVAFLVHFTEDFDFPGFE